MVPMGRTVAETTTPSRRRLRRGRDSVLERFCVAGLVETSKGSQHTPVSYGEEKGAAPSHSRKSNWCL